MHPAAAFYCAWAAALDGTERAEHLVGEHRDSQVELGCEQLAERALSAGHFALERRGERAITAEAEASRLGRELREFLADVRMRPRGHAFEVDFLGEVEQFADRTFHRMPGAARHTLVQQGWDRNLPCGVQLADQIFLGHAHVLVEDLVESRVAGYLDQRTDGDSGAMHIDEQV